MTATGALFGSAAGIVVLAVGLAACAPDTAETDTASAGTPVPAAAATAATTEQQLDVTSVDEKATVFEMLDLGQTGFGPGDELIEQAPVVDADGKTIGTTYTTVVVVSGAGMADAEAIVDCTVELPDGNLLFHGAFDTKDLATGAPIPVVGGTAKYNGASGTVMMIAPTEKATELKFDFTVPSSP